MPGVMPLQRALQILHMCSIPEAHLNRPRSNRPVSLPATRRAMRFSIGTRLPVLPAREQEPLRRLRLQLIDIHQQLERSNRRNRLLLENALDFVRFSLDALTTAALQPARYGTNLAQIAAPSFYIDSKA